MRCFALLTLAGAALELAGRAKPDTGAAMAQDALDNGSAWSKFQAICAAQGGLREPPRAAQTAPVAAIRSGVLKAIDNRKLSRLAKLAGAPERPAAGLTVHKRLGEQITIGEPLLTIHAEASGEIDTEAEFNLLPEVNNASSSPSRTDREAGMNIFMGPLREQ